MIVGLMDDPESKIPNLALMKLSTAYKLGGHQVVLNPPSLSACDKVHVSVLFTWNRPWAETLAGLHPDVNIGGPGWDLENTLPPQIEALPPDFYLYTPEDLIPRMRGIKKTEKRFDKARELVEAGIGFTTRGCIRSCGFCVVPQKEGPLRQVGTVESLLSPRSNRLILLDNNLSADPMGTEKLKEMAERKLIVDISQGIDVRVVTEEFAEALSKVRQWRSLHYAWDMPGHERAVLSGIERLAKFVKTWRHMCFMLVGFDSTFEQDMHRFRTLDSLGVDPYVMRYRGREAKSHFEGRRLNHFSRWVNGRIYTKCPDFEDYSNWAKERDSLQGSFAFA